MVLSERVITLLFLHLKEYMTALRVAFLNRCACSGQKISNGYDTSRGDNATDQQTVLY